MGYLDNTGLAYFWEKIKSNFFPGTKEIPANADLNDYRTPGIYYCPQNTTAATLDNVPGPYAFSLQVYRTVWTSGGDEGCRQILMTYHSGQTSEYVNRVWVRSFYKNDGWTDWYQIVTSMDRPVEYTTVGYESSAYSADKPWHKVAEFPYTMDRSDRRVVFTVTDSYMEGDAAPYGRVDAKYGILRVHIRRKNDFNVEGKNSTKLTWILNTGYDTEDFVLIYIPNTNALELWTRVPNRYNYRTFNVIENGNIYGNSRYRPLTNPLVTYGRVTNTGAQASYPSGDGYIVFKSVMADVQQAAKGIKDCAVQYDLKNARLKTANEFPAGGSVLKYFNATSSITVENGAPTYTNDTTRRNAHVLHMPWDNTGGYDSMLAVPNVTEPLSDGSMGTVSWRAGLGGNGVTTDENGNAIQTGYTDWFHLIDDRFSFDGVYPKLQHNTHFGICTTAKGTAVKSVDIPNFVLVQGAYVIVKFTITNTASVSSLKLDVSGTGAKNIKYHNANLRAAGDLAADQSFIFVYDGTYWQISSAIDRLDQQKLWGSIKAKEAITSGNVIVGDKDGYFHLKSGEPFDVSYPILFASSSISKAAASSNVYHSYGMSIGTTQSGTWTTGKAVFIKGHLDGTIFTPVSTTPLTQDIPTTEDGYQYLYLGFMYTTASIQMLPQHEIYEYANGSFCLYEPKATNADIDSIFD